MYIAYRRVGDVYVAIVVMIMYVHNERNEVKNQTECIPRFTGVPR